MEIVIITSREVLTPINECRIFPIDYDNSLYHRYKRELPTNEDV